jgi:hypothetical protein
MQILAVVLASSAMLAAPSSAPQVQDVLAQGQLGLYSSQDYRLESGRCVDCATTRQGLWYFQDDLVAVPRQAGGRASSLVWVGSPQLVEHVQLGADGRTLTGVGGGSVPMTPVPRLATNHAYYDASTTAFFQNHPLRVRGRSENGTYVARTIWPEDYRLDPGTAAPSDATIDALVTADTGGAQPPFQASLLWQRPHAKTEWAGHAALSFVLSGAQGDDDEAHGGHFALATGTVGPNGEWADWSVDNFYNLDFVSEKGIVAARVPMDNYLMDLNSGQSYYRPVYVLTLLLKQDRTARQYQEAIDPVYDRLYRHDFQYHHSAANCTGISMDALRGVGWQVPTLGPTSYLKGTAAFFYLWAKDHDRAKGEKTFDYLTEEQTRLLPRVAFDAAGADVLQLLRGELKRPLTPYERALQEDVDAVVFMRVPQIPSSRAFGTFPVGSFAEYQARVPADTSKWKIIDVAARPFPDALRDGPAPAPHRSKAEIFASAAVVALLAGVWWVGRGLRKLWRKARARGEGRPQAA